MNLFLLILAMGIFGISVFVLIREHIWPYRVENTQKEKMKRGGTWSVKTRADRVQGHRARSLERDTALKKSAYLPAPPPYSWKLIPRNDSIAGWKSFLWGGFL